MNHGIIFDIRRYSISDGPGIRTTIFLKGCPLRCWWCHNPEGQSFKQDFMHDANKCLKCYRCVNNCPNNAINYYNDNKIMISREKCDLCENCTSICPSQALQLIGKIVSTEYLLEEILKDMPFYEESNGGVTVSGGEPLAQPIFLKSLLLLCKKNNINTAVDTCGYASKSLLLELLNLIDLFLFDIKLIDEKLHIKYTGKSNKLIFENLNLLFEHNKKILIRIPLIRGITDTYENIINVINSLQPYKKYTSISFLPFHNLAEAKYEKLRRKNKLKNILVPSVPSVESIKKIFTQYGFVIEGSGLAF